jgi:hypothetical protein
MELYKEIEKIELQIKQLEEQKQKVIKRLQSACNHPNGEKETLGYTDDDGYGGSAGRRWITTGYKCNVCGLTKLEKNGDDGDVE